MIIRQVDSNNDWTFGKGINSFAKNDEAIGQNIRSRLLSWKNDCFFDLQAGIDWKSRLDAGQRQALEDEARALILQSFGVVAVNSIDATFDGTTRNLSITYNISTIFSASFEERIAFSSGVA